jgi:hypothetical protein
MQAEQTKTQGKENADKLESRLDAIKKARDEVAGEIDLAEGELRKDFQKIEPAVDKAEHELTHMAGKATEAVAKTMNTLADSLRKIHPKAKTEE